MTLQAELALDQEMIKQHCKQLRLPAVAAQLLWLRMLPKASSLTHAI
jgi:hypothetical protein